MRKLEGAARVKTWRLAWLGKGKGWRRRGQIAGHGQDTQAAIRGEQRVSVGEGRDQIHVLKGPWLPWGCGWQSAGLLMQGPSPAPSLLVSLGWGECPLGGSISWATGQGPCALVGVGDRLPALQGVGNSKSLPWPNQRPARLRGPASPPLLGTTQSRAGRILLCLASQRPCDLSAKQEEA